MFRNLALRYALEVSPSFPLADSAAASISSSPLLLAPVGCQLGSQREKLTALAPRVPHGVATELSQLFRAAALEIVQTLIYHAFVI